MVICISIKQNGSMKIALMTIIPLQYLLVIQ